ncbi:MAG: crotonase/enoyl-CoA hydratase family protein [Betaproteobacteria bacterium]|nr:crotonase/enoyl-CoA hydratase family protein [Betaproteobacteria bacterium]
MNMYVPHALLEAPEKLIASQMASGVDYAFSSQLAARFDRELNALWLRWDPKPRPCFNPALLKDLRAYCDFVTNSDGVIAGGEGDSPIEYAVIGSGAPGVFNLGGDLDLFSRLIESRNREGLLLYGRACVDVLYRNYVAYGHPISTISLVQGECLGGGFEAALSSDLIVAEKSARFGFPEILFNLFPGMGAYSFLSRKVGQKVTDELLSGGKVYSADDMLAMGIVDVVAEDGRGEEEVAALIRRRSRARSGLAALSAVRRRIHRTLDFGELLDVVEIWVDSALRLTIRDLKLMQRLVSRQNGVGTGAQVH